MDEIGSTETRLDFSGGTTTEPVIEEIDPFEMAWDRDARQRNLRDARRVWRTRRVPTKEAQAMFPGFDANELHAGWSEVTSEADLMRGNEPTHEGDSGYVTIVQCQWVEKETYWMAEDPLTGEEAEFTPEEYSQANKRLQAAMASWRNRRRLQHKRRQRQPPKLSAQIRRLVRWAALQRAGQARQKRLLTISNRKSNPCCKALCRQRESAFQPVHDKMT